MPDRRDFRDFLRRATGRKLKAESLFAQLAPATSGDSAAGNHEPGPPLGVSERPDIYSPLDENRREIRLCRIQPFSSGQQSISCILSTVSLNDAPNFEALSYVWGDAKDRLPITVNGQQLLVTKNLAAAMRALGSQARLVYPRVVWIDALCIDQSNMAERNSQVTLMGDIYSSARQVISWLGYDLENHVAFVKTQMSAYLLTRDASFLSATVAFGDLPVARVDHIMATVVSLLIGAEIPDPSQTAYNYWHRVWTAQEIVKAKRVIRQSGLAELPLEWLQQFHEYIKSTVSDLNHLRLAGVMNSTIIDTVPGDASAPLLDVLFRLGYRHCTDPRDKIYGLLGISDLARSSHPGIKIDYSLASTPRTVFIGAAQAIIDTTNALDVINYSRPQQTPSEYNLPSWVPSWTPRPEGAPPSLIIQPPTSKPWRAGGKGPAKATFSTSGPHDILSSLGIIYGHVRAVSSRIHVNLDNFDTSRLVPASPSSERLHAHLTKVLAIAYNELVERIPSPSEPPINISSTLNPLLPQGIHSLRQDLLIYLTALHMRGDLPFSPTAQGVYPKRDIHSFMHAARLHHDVSYIAHMLQISSCSLMAVESPQAVRSAEARRLKRLVKKDPVLKEKKILWNGRGNLVLGLCQEIVEEGDVVVLLRGCQSPVVLREVNTEEEQGFDMQGEGRYYRFVGGGYIVGLNEGGLVDKIKVGKGKGALKGEMIKLI